MFELAVAELEGLPQSLGASHVEMLCFGGKGKMGFADEHDAAGERWVEMSKNRYQDEREWESA